MAELMIPNGGKTRLAPTPSGFLHAGNAYNFLVTAELARLSKSTVILRIDDLDTARVRTEYVEDIFRALDWLGITVDEGPSSVDELTTNWSQDLRVARYSELAQKLKKADLLYPCPCSRTELAASMDRGQAHACREAKGATEVGVSMRLRIPDPCHVSVLDLLGAGQDHDLAALMPDPVVLQRDTWRPAYQLASLVDDLDMGVTFIVRGMDLLASTCCQSYMAARTGSKEFASIRFHHHPLLTGLDGAKLSKSEGASSLKAMREAGERPDALRDRAEKYVEGLLRIV